jgi:hypothetical protein
MKQGDEMAARAKGSSDAHPIGSEDCGNAAAVHYTISASAKASQVQAFAYVRDLLVQMPWHSALGFAAQLADIHSRDRARFGDLAIVSNLLLEIAFKMTICAIAVTINDDGTLSRE